MKEKLIGLMVAIIIEMTLGAVVGTIPDPYSSEQLQNFMNIRPVNSTYDQSESWASLAQQENDKAHFWKGIMQLFLLLLAPMITGGIFVWKVL